MREYLVPACLCHAVDVLLMSGAATVDDTVAIAVAVVYTVSPFAGDIAVAGVVDGCIGTGVGCDIGLC